MPAISLFVQPSSSSSLRPILQRHAADAAVSTTSLVQTGYSTAHPTIATMPLIAITTEHSACSSRLFNRILGLIPLCLCLDLCLNLCLGLCLELPLQTLSHHTTTSLMEQAERGTNVQGLWPSLQWIFLLCKSLDPRDCQTPERCSTTILESVCKSLTQCSTISHKWKCFTFCTQT